MGQEITVPKAKEIYYSSVPLSEKNCYLFWDQEKYFKYVNSIK